ncbi:MAG: hypothetical protein ABL866_06490 [Devosia sp.]
MATQDRDPLYPNDSATRTTIYNRESNTTAWFVGIIVALALLGIAYLVFSANSQPATTNLDINTPPASVTVTPPADTNTTPMAPVETTPATPVEPAPVEPTPVPLEPAPATPAPAPTN